MNLKEAKKRWSSLWSQDDHAAAICALCGATRLQSHQMVEGVHGYVCDACTFLAVGVVGAFQGDETNARPAALNALDCILAALSPRASFANLEPLLEAMLRLARHTADVENVFAHAVAHGHEELGLRALASTPREQRSARTSMNLAATYINLERFDEAGKAIEDARKTADGDDSLYLDCHEAMLAVRGDQVVDETKLEELIARTRRAANEALLVEALEVVARNRAARGNVPAALAAIDEALATGRKAPLLLLRGDLLVGTDPGSARAAWEEALTLVHPEGIYARRAQERMRHLHPYRAGFVNPG